MKLFLKLASVFMLSALIFYACNDDIVRPQDQLGSDPFPNSVGVWWEYQRFDSLTSKIDTIHVEITDTVTLPNGELSKIWLSTVNGKVVDTSYVSIVTVDASDSVKIYKAWDFTAPQMLYAFPLESGASWVNSEVFSNSCQYDFTVTGVETIETPLAAYPGAFSVWRADFPNNCFSVSDNFIRRRVWLVNRLGMVKNLLFSDDIQNTPPSSNEIWTLIDFDVTPSL